MGNKEVTVCKNLGFVGRARIRKFWPGEGARKRSRSAMAMATVSRLYCFGTNGNERMRKEC